MTDINLRILLTAQNSTSSAIKAVTGDLGEMNTALLGIGVGAAALAIGIGVKAVQAAAAYQSAMTQLQNTTGSSDAQMKQYTATIRQLSDTTGTAQTDLAAGMYQIVSANFAGADATRILTTATQAAIIAHADQTKVTTGLVVTLNAFGLKAKDVDTVSNQMFKTLSLGRGQMGDLAGALQTGGALVAHYGVSVKDMDATLATLSTGGMKTFGTSMTGLTQLLNVMDGKTDLITGRMHKLGINFDENKFKAMSYTDQIAYLTEAFKGHEKQMVAVLGSKQAATALGILGTQSQLLTSNLKKLGDTQELAKEKTTAWSKVQGDFNFQWEKFKTNMGNLLIDLGLKLLPYLTPIVKQFSDWATTLQYSFVPWLRNAVDDISKFVGWMQQGSMAASDIKGALVLLGLALAGVKIVDFGKNAVNAFNDIKSKVGNVIDAISGSKGIGDAAKTAEKAVGESAKKMEGELAGEAGIEGSANKAAAAIKGIGGASTGIGAALGGLATGIATIAGVVAILGIEAYLLKDAAAALAKAWTDPNYKPPTGPGGVHPARHASGIMNSPVGHWATVGERGPEMMYVPQGASILPNGVSPASAGSGNTFVFNVSTMAGSRAEIVRMVDLLEQEMAQRFRSQTSYGFGGIV